LIGSSQLQFATPFYGNFLVTLMLASVTDAEEAETAVQHGAEIIDVKDVDGPFGTAAPRPSRRRSHGRCGDYRQRWRELR
jgi:hypothetical protein